MAKVKIPLEMANGVMARNMDEFKDNFDLEKVLGHYMSGKLLTWLNDRYYEDEAEQVGALSSEEPELDKKLCEIFGAEYSSDIDPETVARRNERLAKLRQLTDDDEIIANVDSVAFDQEELAELYDNGVEKIYLGEGSFKIPKSKQDLIYVEFAGAKVEGLFKKEEPKTEEVYKTEKISVMEQGDYFYQSPVCEGGIHGTIIYIDKNGTSTYAPNDCGLDNHDHNLDNHEYEMVFDHNLTGYKGSKIINIDYNWGIDSDGVLYTKHGSPHLPPIKQVVNVSTYPYAGGYFILDTHGNVHYWAPENSREFEETWINVSSYHENRGHIGMPKNLPPIKQLVTDRYTVYAIDTDGQIYAWGDSDTIKSIPKNLPPIIKIAANNKCAVALGEDGKLYSWGSNWSRCGGFYAPSDMPRIVDIGDLKDSAVVTFSRERGKYVIPVLDENGRVHICGAKSEAMKYWHDCEKLPTLKRLLPAKLRRHCLFGLDYSNRLYTNLGPVLDKDGNHVEIYSND